MRRHEIINWFIDKKGYKTYLEIGVDNPNNCFNLVNCENKIGVDPVKGGTHKMTSDEFFSCNRLTFDISFIDGLHHDYQVLKDVINSLDCLNSGGTIVVHDLYPKNEKEQIVPRETQVWTGNGWKAWAYLRANRCDLTMYVLDTDHGVGVIRKGRQKLYTGSYEDYRDFKNNYKKLLNLKCVDEIY